MPNRLHACRRRAASWWFACATTFVAVLPGAALETGDLVKINEISYDPNEVVNNNEEPFEYIELYNAGTTTAYLDGAAVSDEGGSGTTEATFVFPGVRGGTTIPLAPGAFMLLVVDATGSPWGGGAGNSLARYEFFAGGTDTDDPTIPNLTKTAGQGLDLSFANAGDGVTLSNGVSNGSVIPCAEIVDGASWETGGSAGDVTPLSNTVCTDASPNPGYTNGGPSLNQTLQRGSDGLDTNASSAADFHPALRSPGAPNTRTNLVGIYADSTASIGGPLCAPIGTVNTLYVVAILGGASSTGIRGAEFRIEVSNPSGYFFTFHPATGISASGDPMDLQPADSLNASGTTLLLNTCRPAAPAEGARVVLGRLEIANLSGGPVTLRVLPKIPATAPAQPCAAFNKCDAPVLTRVCMNAAPGTATIFSAPLQGGICAPVVLPPPVGLTALPTGTYGERVALAWLPPGTGTPTGYRVYRKVGTGAEVLLADGVTATSYTDALPVLGQLCYTVVGLSPGPVEGLRSNTACLQYTPVFIPEVMTLDLHEAADDAAAGPVVTTQSLISGREFLVTIEGTFSRYPASLWDSPPNVQCGAPETQPIIPSPGMNNNLVSDDADFRFAAALQPGGNCMTLETSGLPSHPQRLQFDLGAGVGFTHYEPQGGVPPGAPPQHKYSYVFPGNGHRFAVRYLDQVTSDNYGQLRITVAEVTQTDAGGGARMPDPVAEITAFPNPFNPTVRIECRGAAAANETIAIVDAAGRRRRLLHGRRIESGRRVFVWDGRNEDGSLAASGVYWATPTTGTAPPGKQIVLVR